MIKNKLKNLLSTHPELCKEWDTVKNLPLTPELVSSGSHQKVWWICKNNHKWFTSMHNRKRGRGCPYCSGFYSSPEKSLFTLRKDLMLMWNYSKNVISPKDVSVSSGKKVWWICNKKHEWEAKISHISKGVGCPFCSGRNSTPEDNLLIKRPDLMAEWDYKKNLELDPEKIKSSSGKRVWWKCKNGHEWSATIDHRNNGRGCPYCNAYKMQDGAFCSSLIEAFYYILLKEEGISFSHNKKYPGHKRKIRFDFYIPSQNKYIEVTAYSEKYKYWDKYIKNINEKRLYVENNLKANFEFINRTLLPEELCVVLTNTIRTLKNR